jgi:FkbM family methyltransferase
MKFLAIFFLLPFYKFFFVASYRRYVWLVLRHGWARRYTPRSVHFAGARFHIPDALSFTYQYLEIYQHEIYRFTPSRPKPLILDCGANVGTSVLFFAQNYPDAEIHAYEPDPSIFGYLKENVEYNKLKNISLHQAAIWTHDDFLYFQQEGADGGAVGTEADNTIKVKSADFKNILLQHEHIDFLKMDIEGAEVEVIEYAKGELHRIENFFIEYHSHVSSPQALPQILTALSESGFRYTLETALHIKKPFQTSYKKNSMDIQLNIFAHRIAAVD